MRSSSLTFSPRKLVLGLLLDWHDGRSSVARRENQSYQTVLRYASTWRQCQAWRRRVTVLVRTGHEFSCSKYLKPWQMNDPKTVPWYELLKGPSRPLQCLLIGASNAPAALTAALDLAGEKLCTCKASTPAFRINFTVGFRTSLGWCPRLSGAGFSFAGPIAARQCSTDNGQE